jgi:hypothetical protein
MTGATPIKGGGPEPYRQLFRVAVHDAAAISGEAASGCFSTKDLDQFTRPWAQ